MRAGSAAMMARRCSGLIPAQPAISCDGAAAADAKPRLAVEQADIDARRFQGRFGPADGPWPNVGIAARPGNCGWERHACSLPRRIKRPGYRSPPTISHDKDCGAPIGRVRLRKSMQLAPYFPLVGRSGVAPSRSSSEAAAHRRCLTPPGALRQHAALPIKGRDGARCDAQASLGSGMATQAG